MQKEITRFSVQLGWGKPEVYQHSPKQDDQPDKIVWYEAGDIGNPRTDCFIQINELEADMSGSFFSAAVYAPRYQICSGWHVVDLNNRSEDPIAHETQRLEGWLHKQNFLTIESRRRYRILHPETIGYSWSKIRQFGPPYYVKVFRKNSGFKARMRKSERCREALSRKK